MTAYTGNGSNVAATTVTTANKLAPATGGTETSTNTSLITSTTGWVIIRAQGTGTAQSGAGSEPTITDSNNFGWMTDDGTFDGQTFAVGNWTPTVALKINLGTIVADIHCVILKRPSGGGTYSVIGDLVKTAQTITTTRTAFAFSASSLSGIAFATGDRLCTVWILNITTGGGSASLLTCYMSTSASTGVASDAQIVSPGYSPSATTSTRTVPMSAALLATNTRTVPMTASLSATKRTVPMSAALLLTHTRTVPLTAALQSTSTRPVPLNAALLATKTRTVPLTAALTVPGPASGGFCLWANGTGVATFDHFRATQYPDPSLSLAPVLPRLGSSYIGWNVTLPSSATTDSNDASLDGVNWTNVPVSGSAIPGLNQQPSPTNDVWLTNSSVNYTSTNRTGGATATVTYDSANSRLSLMGGTNALYLNSLISWADVDIFCDTDQVDAGGLVWRFVDGSDYYVLVIADASASVGTPNRATLYKVAANVQTQLAQATIAFTRGTYHRFRVTMLFGVITATMDGVALFTYTDNTPLVAGLIGLYNNGGSVGSRYYQLWIQPQGDYVTGTPPGDIVTSTFVYTKERLATTDATVTPQLLDLEVAAYGPQIGNGAYVPQADYQATFISANLDDLATKSNDVYWQIDQNSELEWRERVSVPAPWILDATDQLVWELSVDYSGDWYSNRQVLRGIVDVQAFQDIKIGDGNATSFALSFPLASAPTVTLNGNPQKVGVKGIDSGKNWYWQVGDPTIYQDSGGVVLISTDVLVVSGLGTYTTTVTRDNLAGQAERAAVEGGTTGIVTNVTDTKSLGLTLNIAGAQAYGDSLNARYGVIGRTVTFTTIKTGLMQGQMLACFVPQRQMVNTQMLITSVEVTQRTYRTAGNTASTRWVYLVSATELPNSRSWSRQLTSALFGSTGKGKHS